MTHACCDMCGRWLPRGPEGRFVVRIEVFAPPGPIEFTAEDLQRDRSDEIRQLVERLSRLSAQEIEDQVYRSFHFDLCPRCQKEYLRQPLPRRPSDDDARGG